MKSPASRRVLLADQTADVWGGQTVLRMAVAAYLEAGWTVRVLAPSGGELERSIERDHGREVEWLPLTLPRFNAGRKTPIDLLRLLLLTGRFRRYRGLLADCDLIHVNGPRLWWPVHRALGARPVSLLLHVHLDHSSPEKRLLGRILRTRAGARALAVSPFVHRRLSSHPATGSSGGVVELENALALDPPPFQDRLTDRPFETVAVPGRIGAEKGQLSLLRIAPSFPQLRFLVIGAADPVGRPVEERLRREAPPNVELLGRVRDVGETLDQRGVQAVIVPSQWEEPFGLVALEAMAASCTTLVRSRGGLVDIAAATGAIPFDTDDDAVDQLRRLVLLSAAEHAELARRQHEATVRRYAPRHWRERLLTIVEEMVPATRV